MLDGAVLVSYAISVAQVSSTASVLCVCVRRRAAKGCDSGAEV